MVPLIMSWRDGKALDTVPIPSWEQLVMDLNALRVAHMSDGRISLPHWCERIRHYIIDVRNGSRDLPPRTARRKGPRSPGPAHPL